MKAVFRPADWLPLPVLTTVLELLRSKFPLTAHAPADPPVVSAVELPRVPGPVWTAVPALARSSCLVWAATLLELSESLGRALREGSTVNVRELQNKLVMTADVIAGTCVGCTQRRPDNYGTPLACALAKKHSKVPLAVLAQREYSHSSPAAYAQQERRRAALSLNNSKKSESGFSLVIVDEASQAPERAALLPLSLLARTEPTAAGWELENLAQKLTRNGERIASKCTLMAAAVDLTTSRTYATRAQLCAWGAAGVGAVARVAFVGDHCQLPPIAGAGSDEAGMLLGADSPMFARLACTPTLLRKIAAARAAAAPGTRAAAATASVARLFVPTGCMLLRQHRMHSALAVWSSRTFYSGALTTPGFIDQDRPPVRGFTWFSSRPTTRQPPVPPFTHSPMVLIDTSAPFALPAAASRATQALLAALGGGKRTV